MVIVRGRQASRIKTGTESDDMENTGFKMLLCCRNIGMNLLLSCAAQENVAVCGEEKRHGDNLFVLVPYLRFAGRRCFARKLERQSSSFLCNCVPARVCSLPWLLAECDFPSDHDRGATVQLFCSCLCSRTSRQRLQQWKAMSPR